MKKYSTIDHRVSLLVPLFLIFPILLDSLLQEIDNDAFEALKYISDFILMLLC